MLETSHKVKMNPRIKELWVAALRSGQYPKGRGRMYQKINGRAYYCPLGVLCEIYSQETGIDWTETKKNDSVGFYMHGASVCLPEEVMQWAGLDDPWVEFEVEGYGWVYPDHMSDAGLSFSTLAELIERGL